METKKTDTLGKLKNVYFGWWTVLATAIVSAWSWGTWGYGFGAYFKPLQQEFGWTRAQISAAYSLNKLEGGLEGPWGGVITDKYGPRIVSVMVVPLVKTVTKRPLVFKRR